MSYSAPSPDVRWFWAIHVVDAYRARIVTTGRAPTLDMAKAAFRLNWTRYEEWKGPQ